MNPILIGAVEIKKKYNFEFNIKKALNRLEFLIAETTCAFSEFDQNLQRVKEVSFIEFQKNVFIMLSGLKSATIMGYQTFLKDFEINKNMSKSFLKSRNYFKDVADALILDEDANNIFSSSLFKNLNSQPIKNSIENSKNYINLESKKEFSEDLLLKNNKDLKMNNV